MKRHYTITHMMKLLTRFLFPFCFLLFPLTLVSQGEKCATETAWQQLQKKFGHIHHAFEKWDAIQQLDQTRLDRSKTAGIVTIPVVVHVVYNTPAENIADAQIFSQIDVLNEDFRKMNADTANLRSVFKPVAGDSKIEFCLAKRDPSGAATTGITRTSTAVSGFGTDDHMKFDSLGGKNAWPSDQYLNIWVCRLTTANGYAYYPGGNPDIDGIVVHYLAFGDTLDVIAPYHLGRTATHEVGHWLGLRHTFEDGCAGTTASTCAAAGDRVCDTPADNTPSYGCDTTENSCTDSPTDLPDQVENFMDYADDACTNMFSIGQVDRMNGFLYTTRASLITSLGCLPPGSTVVDAAAIEITDPLSGICDSTFSPMVRIGNIGGATLTSLDIYYSLDGGTPVLYGWTGSILGGTSAIVPLPAISTGSGTHTLEITIDNANGAGADPNPGNDDVAASILIYGSGSAIGTTVSEGFEGGAVPPTDWTVVNPEGDITWENGPEGGYGLSSTSAWMDNFYIGWDGIGTTDDLISMPLDFTGAPAPMLSFDVAYMDPDHWFYSDTLSVWYSTDCGDTWNQLWKDGGTTLSTAPHDTIFQPFVPDSSQWTTLNVNLSSLVGSPFVQLRFQHKSGWGNDMYLDNINLTGIVGIDALGEHAVKIYPNPTSGRVEVSIGYRMLAYPVHVEVWNLQGQKLFEEDFQESEFSFQLPGSLPDGQYFIRLIQAGDPVGWNKPILLMR